jgi:hypothetical protein
LINGAEINIRFKGKLAKDCTDNLRICFLIEKYEILKANQVDGESSDDMNSDFDPTPQNDPKISFVQKI